MLLPLCVLRDILLITSIKLYHKFLLLLFMDNQWIYMMCVVVHQNNSSFQQFCVQRNRLVSFYRISAGICIWNWERPLSESPHRKSCRKLKHFNAKEIFFMISWWDKRKLTCDFKRHAHCRLASNPNKSFFLFATPQKKGSFLFFSVCI